MYGKREVLSFEFTVSDLRRNYARGSPARTPVKSRTISPAIISPATDGTNAMLEGGTRRARGSSVEYTTLQ